MAKFVPSFKVEPRAQVSFSTNNPFGRDRESVPVIIEVLAYNADIRTIEATGSDGRKRQCRIDRFSDDKLLKKLTSDLQAAYNTGTEVVFVAAGGNDPNVWFYNVIIVG